MADGMGGAKTFTINAGNQLVIDNFGAFGTDNFFPASAAELDTLVFSGAIFTATNMILTQAGANVIVTFAGDTQNTSVTLTKTTIEKLENIAGAGNFQFNGQAMVTESLDVWNAGQNDSTVNAGTVTFLNAKNNVVTGSTGIDVINGLGGKDTLAGDLGDDILRGDDGDDILDGGAGDDLLVGGKGSDTYKVDSINDKVSETLSAKSGGGIDTIITRVDYTLGRNVDNITLEGSVGITGYGNSLANVMVNNLTSNGALYGAGGNDSLKSIVSGILVGGGGNDKLQAGSSGSHLFGGTGVDILTGGAGGDDFYIDSAKDKIIESAKTGGVDVVHSLLSFSLKSLTNVENLLLSEGGNFTATGNALSNVLQGNSGNNTLDGGAGDDDLSAYTGNDVLIGGAGSDIMNGGGGNDIYFVDNIGDKIVEAMNGGNDTVILAKTVTKADLEIAFKDMSNAQFFTNIENVTYQGSLAWKFTGDAKANKLTGGSGNDILDGQDGDNVLDGGKGADILKGTDGNDTYILDNKNDRIEETGTTLFQSLRDLILSSVDVDLTSTGPSIGLNLIENVTLTGKAGLKAIGNDLNNILTGNGGANKLDGGLGADTLIGDAGNDLLTGGGGNDDLYGGAGNDSAFFSGAKANYTIAYDSSNAALIVTDNRVGSPDGIDTLHGIETLIFSDGKIAMPVIKDTNSQANAVSESAIGGAKVGITAHIAGSNVFYALLDDADGRFVINALSGEVALTAKGLLDYEANTIRNITIQAVNKDNANQHLLAEQSFTIKILDDKAEKLNAIDLGAMPIAKGFHFDGLKGGEHAGYSVSSAGDFNGDGIDDVLISAANADSNGIDSGSAYLLFGKSGGFGAADNLASLDGVNGFRIDGSSAGDYLGSSIAMAGDVNGDGFSDIVIGAKGYGSSDQGAAYVIFGGNGNWGPVVDVANLNGGNGFRLTGAVSGDNLGRSVSTAGDINGDGYDDFIIGASGADFGAASSGSSYVVFGQGGAWSPSAPVTGNFVNGLRGFRLDGGSAGDISGVSVSGGGDLDGDGLSDLVIGAPSANSGGKQDSGAAYLHFATDGTAGPITVGVGFAGPVAGYQAGSTVAILGDINGDGFDDLGITAPGGDAAYVIFGASDLASAAPSLDLDQMGSRGFKISAQSAGGNLSIAAAGDVNGDGIADLILGSAVNFVGLANAGASYVIYGHKSAFNPTLDVAVMKDSEGFRIDGALSGDASGYSVSAAGDLNGDGFGDLLVGAPNADSNGAGSGAAYVIYGGNFTNFPMKIGSAKDDKLTGTVNADTIIGGLGNDILTGKGGADVFHGGTGNDEIHVSDINFALADGGGGIDTLSLDFAGNIGLLGLGLSYKLGNVENIDIVDMENGFGDNVLQLTPEDILSFGSDPRDINQFDTPDPTIVSNLDNVLRIEGDIGDQLHLSGAMWSSSLNAIPGYALYQTGNIKVLVDLDIDVT